MFTFYISHKASWISYQVLADNKDKAFTQIALSNWVKTVTQSEYQITLIIQK